MTQQEITTAIEKIDELIEAARESLGVPSKDLFRDIQDRADDLYDRI